MVWGSQDMLNFSKEQVRDLSERLAKLNKSNNCVPESLDELVYPVGEVALKVPQEQIDSAIELVERELQRIKQESKSENKPEVSSKEKVDMVSSTDMTDLDASCCTETPAEVSTETTTLTAEQIAALPKTRFGRDSQGRALNKDGSVRQPRNDKNKKRAGYNKKVS